MTKILIIEDEEPISELIKMNLDFANFSSIQAFDGDDGLDIVNNDSTIDLVLLDIMLPKKDGFELLPIIVKKNIPVILLTSKDGLNDKVKCLNMGADDYILKPFESIELIARINSVLRRTSKQKVDYSFDDIDVNIQKMEVTKAGVKVILTLKEFELLRVLLENKGITLSREKLLQLVWDYDYEGDTRTVDMHIQKLRKKLGTNRITTLFKSGYRLDV